MEDRRKPEEIRMSNWTHKVVKFSRRMDGKFFAHRTAFTGTLDECTTYAREFAMEQNTPSELGTRLSGHEIRVIARSGNHSVATFRINSDVPAGQCGERVYA